MRPYRVETALMDAAQSHSEYQASVDSIRHTGAWGTSVRDSAIAFGFGEGAAVFVSENIAEGNQASVDNAAQLWQGDALHLNTMLFSNYQDVGAGVAVSGDAVYITLDEGCVAGSTSPLPPVDTVPPTTNPQIVPSAATDKSLLPTEAEPGTNEEDDQVNATRTLMPTIIPISTQTKEQPSRAVSASLTPVFSSSESSSDPDLLGKLFEENNSDSRLLIAVAVIVVVGTALLLAGVFFRRQW